MIKLSMILAATATLGAGAWHVSRSPTSALPYYSNAQLTPEWVTDRTASDDAFHHVAPFTLRDQHNAVVSERALAHEATVIHFFFTQCGGVCPTTQMNLARMLATFPIALACKYFRIR